mgnify:CR=1 FL=1
MTIWQAFILGIVQGITEFLPISSSGHLVITPYLLNWEFPKEQVFVFDVLVQMGTLVAVIFYFRTYIIRILNAFFKGIISGKPFANPDSRLGWFVVIATLPAVIGGLLLKDLVESAFHSILATAFFLIMTAVLLWLVETFAHQEKDMQKITPLDALIIGFFQMLSLFPGLSRSGATISGGVIRKLHREEAAKFSFLMSIPVMIGAGVLSVNDLISIPNVSEFLPALMVGFLTAMLVGYFSIHWLLKFLNKNKLTVFSFYCLILAAITILVYFLRA